jgi:hypothetical protein
MKKTSIKPNDAVAEFGCVRWGAQATRSDCAFQEFRSINHMAVRGLAEA